jgi:hypothetical protein
MKTIMRLLAVAAFTLTSLAPLTSAQNAALRIVVVEGEDAVNVIQQKSAVAPVIEVRDRNDQPVSGAVVRFAISKGRASFSGARALTVTTNTAGRAIAAGLTPTGSGALQISAAATFQGQTAVATIAQTNVMTAAAAGAGSAGAGGGASAGGGAAGSGGGLSATTVGIVGGAVAGGTIAAKEVLGGSGAKGTVSYQGPYSGLVADVFFGVAASCTRTLQHSGTVQMDLDVADDGTVTGQAHVSGTMTLAQVKPGCEPPVNPQSHGDQTQVQGTKNTITFHGSHGGLTPDVTANYDFDGAFAGDAITGTFTLDINSNCCRTLGVFPVTLQKQ